VTDAISGAHGSNPPLIRVGSKLLLANASRPLRRLRSGRVLYEGVVEKLGRSGRFGGHDGDAAFGLVEYVFHVGQCQHAALTQVGG